MSLHKSTTIDQKEYLKKYLSGDKDKKKKKKHKKSKNAIGTKVKIIDDDCFDNFNAQVDEDLLLGGEDAPQIVGEYIENDPSARSKWRNIAVKDEPEENGVKQENNEDDDDGPWGRKNGNVKIKQEANETPILPAIKIKQEKRSSSRDLSPSRPKIDSSPPRRLRDADPPRGQRRRDSDDESPPRRHLKQEQSPPRRPRRNSDQTPPRKRQNSDQSPPRRRKDSDQSPPRSRRDQSPPRRGNQSPPRRRRDSDQSPPRRQRRKDDSPPIKRRDSDDQSPPRRKPKVEKSSPRRKRRDSDQSPPRRRSDSDQSPPRRQRKNSDQSPPRRKPKVEPPSSPRRRRNDSDQSPPRRRRDSDQSPPRRRGDDYSGTSKSRSVKKESDYSPERRTKKEERRSASPPPPPASRKSRWAKASPSPSPPPTHKGKISRTLDGKVAGLQNAQSLKAESDQRRRREQRMYEEMSTEISGRDADVQIRNTGRRGKRARDAAAEDPAERKRKEEHEKKKKELYDKWGKGLKQLEDKKARHAEMAHEASKPMARYANDEDLEQHLREQEHADDPMLQYMREKRKKRAKEANEPAIPVYEGTFPENRFGIRPGYRWDGVNRSNGYEQRWFDKQSEKIALQDEAYKYSVEDM